MKGALIRAARTSTHESTTDGQGRMANALDTGALSKLAKRESLLQFTSAARASKRVNSLLEDPKLPSQRDTERWWPDPQRPQLSPLIPFASRGDAASYQMPATVSPGDGGATSYTDAQDATRHVTAPRAVPTMYPKRPNTAQHTFTVPIVRSNSQPAMGQPQPGSMFSKTMQSHSGMRRVSARNRSKDPSRSFGNPGEIEFPEAKDSPDVFEQPMGPNLQLRRLLERTDGSDRLKHWMNSFDVDEETFKSKALLVEMRLRQALASSVELGVPNAFRTAIVCDAFERTAPLTGRLEGLLTLIWREIIQSIYFDFSHDLPGSGAKVYAERTPYFLETKRLRELNEEHARREKRMKAWRDSEMKDIQGKNNLINKTLGAWNRALGSAAGTAEVDSLRERLVALEKLLSEATAEVARLTDVDQVAKCVAAFDACSLEEQHEVLMMHILKSESASSAMVGNATEDVTEHLNHLLSKLPGESLVDSFEATRGRVLAQLSGTLSDEEKLAMAVKIFAEFGNPHMMGAALGDALVAAVPRLKEVVSGLAERLHADADPYYQPPTDDSGAILTHQVLKAMRRAFTCDEEEYDGASRARGPGSQFGLSDGAGPGGGGRGSRAGGRQSRSYHGRNYDSESFDAAAAEKAEVDDQVEDLRRRHAAGELTAEDLAELERLEGRLAALDDVMAAVDPEITAAEAVAVSKRAEDLQKRQATGEELTPEELAELNRLEAQLAERKARLAAEAEAGAIKDRVGDLKRRQAAGKVTAEELAELNRLEGRLAELDDVRISSKGGRKAKGGRKTNRRGKGNDDDDDDDDADAEADEARTKVAELNRRKKAGELTDVELAELEGLEGKLKKLEATANSGRARKKGGHRGPGGKDNGYNNAKGVKLTDFGCQVGQSFGLGSGMGSSESSSSSGTSSNGKLPTSAMTSLCEIKFNRKDVNAMNTLMCRRLISALFQVKIDLNVECDKQLRTRQSFPEFVPDQFAVLYGIKSIAITKLNEFLYGIRANRMRKTAVGVAEQEPMLYMFWRLSHHGVPFEERLPHDEFDIYLDILGSVAQTVGEEHTLKMKGSGAFWNLYGSMAEIELPIFVLINSLQRQYGSTHNELFERMKKVVTHAATKAAKDAKAGKVQPTCPSYKQAVLGSAGLDSRGTLPLETFLQLCLENAGKQRVKDGKELQAFCDQWTKASKMDIFAAFRDMMYATCPELPDERIISLYQKSTSGEDPDKIEMVLIEPTLRKLQIGTQSSGLKYVIKRKSGTSSVADGAADWDDMKMAGLALNLFGKKTKSQGGTDLSDDLNSKMSDGFDGKKTWQRAGTIAGRLHTAYARLGDILMSASAVDESSQ